MLKTFDPGNTAEPTILMSRDLEIRRPLVVVLDPLWEEVYLLPYPSTAGHRFGPSGRGLVKMMSKTRTLPSSLTRTCKKHVPLAQVPQGPLKGYFYSIYERPRGFEAKITYPADLLEGT